ncbi:type II toxin-antitoxin system VapC family toxin [Candidatus Methylobacter oryzae]|uniref:type II toxin-antitoxin system VapC family toxin n=1 Tax=Candidatus Methylobacter oryzae TaxID=2497749 RepID=UPI001386ADDC|nr:PIN domain-containing protein [Candidatus Methylobacter oryzae]
MEAVIVKTLYLDTHILVWLYQDGATRLTPLAVRTIEEAEQLLISPMVELELTYLHEISHINCPALNILDSLRRDIGLETCKQPFAAAAGEALTLGWTRDPFDRLIVAQAAHRASPLLTADQNIREHYSGAIW